MTPAEQRFCFDNQASRIDSDCKVAPAATLPTSEQVHADRGSSPTA
jgi:hypothetical protein